ncbi:MAG: ATP synthase F0 subunit B [Bdellovibrionaceae bacterium]|nr:ATP synthase F0 subunit B [Pseudobdellovibrionaceae bacterium]
MEIIHQLGINQTALIQFAIFVCMFFFLNIYLFTPYYLALKERETRTLGGEDLALELQKKSTELHSEYQVKAKEVSKQIKEIYDSHRNDAVKEYDLIVGKAREEAAELLEKNNKTIGQAIQAVAASLGAETTTVSMVITQKLLGK